MEDSIARFHAAFDSLATDTSHTPSEVQNILGILQEEVNAVQIAINKHKGPWDTAWPHLVDPAVRLQVATARRPSGRPSYGGLAKMNWYHFGGDAQLAYTAGHLVAINVAFKGGSQSNLELAYAMNAFADHFLQDLFSAGHIRTPRRALHASSTLDPFPDTVCQGTSSDRTSFTM